MAAGNANDTLLDDRRDRPRNCCCELCAFASAGDFVSASGSKDPTPRFSAEVLSDRRLVRASPAGDLAPGPLPLLKTELEDAATFLIVDRVGLPSLRMGRSEADFIDLSALLDRADPAGSAPSAAAAAVFVDDRRDRP